MIRSERRVVATTALCLALQVGFVLAQASPPAVTPGPAKADTGIPVRDALVQTSCGPCHAIDDAQLMSRISFQRRTPEGWQNAVRRMVALNGLSIEPEAARHVVKYLSNQLGLAPEEAMPAAFEAERRLVDFKYTASADTEPVCTACHSMGRVMAQRRTKEEWTLLTAMHRGLYPFVDFQAFRRMGPPPREPGPDGRPPDLRHPVEKAVAHLSQAFPLQTAEWAAWSANARSPRIAGTWSLSGWEPGKGALFGTVVITAAPSTTDEFTTEITFTYARTGQRITRTGRAIVYTGFQWRGRSMAGAEEATSLREVMFVDRDWQRIEGRWFTGGYDEIGMDVRLGRLGPQAAVLGTDKAALRTGTSGQEVRIYGANLPTVPRPADVDFGPGVTVSRVVEATPDRVTVLVDVSADAKVGARDLVVAGAVKPTALAVYDRIDAIKVTPVWNMARVGGGAFPKMFAQFEAWAYHNGADDKPDTADDVSLGVVPATWALEEYTATYGDDDTKFVGSIDTATGLFTPALDGPNPQRSGSRNNVGDVWVVASYSPETDGSGPAKDLRARAHLLVTVPLYMRWDPSVTQ